MTWASLLQACSVSDTTEGRSTTASFARQIRSARLLNNNSLRDLASLTPLLAEMLLPSGSERRHNQISAGTPHRWQVLLLGLADNPPLLPKRLASRPSSEYNDISSSHLPRLHSSKSVLTSNHSHPISTSITDVPKRANHTQATRTSASDTNNAAADTTTNSRPAYPGCPTRSRAPIRHWRFALSIDAQMDPLPRVPGVRSPRYRLGL